MRPKLAVITVTSCHLIPVIAFAVSGRTSNMTASSAGLANHRVPVMTNHAPGGKPESVPIARLRRTT
jgi:hypothetical protein